MDRDAFRTFVFDVAFCHASRNFFIYIGASLDSREATIHTTQHAKVHRL